MSLAFAETARPTRLGLVGRSTWRAFLRSPIEIQLPTRANVDPMVFEGSVDAIVQIVLAVGVPLLVVLFYLEGLIIGKILQPPAVFIGVVAVTTPPWPLLAVLSVACTLSVVTGQWTTYRSFDAGAPDLLGVRRRFPTLDRLPDRILARIGDRRYRIIDGLFERYGGVGIFVTTFLPGIRGLLAVPAGLSSYPVRRFLAVSLLGNALYFPVLVAIAFGILQLLGLG